MEGEGSHRPMHPDLQQQRLSSAARIRLTPTVQVLKSPCGSPFEGECYELDRGARAHTLQMLPSSDLEQQNQQTLQQLPQQSRPSSYSNKHVEVGAWVTSMRELLARSCSPGLASDASASKSHPSFDTASHGEEFGAEFSGGGWVGRTSTPLDSVVGYGSVRGEVSCLDEPWAPSKGEEDHDKGAMLDESPLMITPLYSSPHTSSTDTLRSSWRRPKAPAADASPSSLIHCEGDESCGADRDMSSPPLAGGTQAARHGGGGNIVPLSSSPKPSDTRDSDLGTSIVLSGVHNVKGETTGCQEGAMDPTEEEEYIFSLVMETRTISYPGEGGGLGDDPFSTVNTAGLRSTPHWGEPTQPFLNTPTAESPIEKSELANFQSSLFFADKIVTTDFDDRNIRESSVPTSINKVPKTIRGGTQPKSSASKHGESPKKEEFVGARHFPNLNGEFQRRVQVVSAEVMPSSLLSMSVVPIPSVPIKTPNTAVNPFGQDDVGFTEEGGALTPSNRRHGPPEQMSILSSPYFEKKMPNDDIAFSTTSSASLEEVRVRRKVEDTEVDERTTEAERTVNVVETEGGMTSRVVVEEEAVSRVLAAVSGEETIVLPCAPTEKEKVMYYKSGRFMVVSFAIPSFLALSTGAWLFTIERPAFYWFGLPSLFLTIYLGCHYLGVAIWGKDFSPEAHAEIVRSSEQRDNQPIVDVFLPVCKEPTYLLANTWKHVSALDYVNIRVHVLDDGNEEEVKALAEAFGFNYIVRPDRPLLRKAGNLRHAFTQTSGDAIAIFDADFCPRPDFLRETVPYLDHDESIGIVQTPQYFRYRQEQTWIEQGAGITQEFFYRLVQVNQDRFNASVCVGSCGLYRRSALAPFGGIAAVSHSEDMYTGFKMTEHGYRIKYVPLPLAMGTCPDEPQSFFMQQYRWAMGSATLVTEKEFWRSNVSSIHKLCFLNGLLYYVATSLMLFLAPIPVLMLVWINADKVLWYQAGFTLPSIAFATVVMPGWCTQRYAHLYAIKDRLMGRSAPWVPSGTGASKGMSPTYKSSVRLLVVWNVLSTALVVGGCILRMTELTWYHFIPAMGITLGGFILSISTLFSC